jgi:hypothetical protein
MRLALLAPIAESIPPRWPACGSTRRTSLPALAPIISLPVCLLLQSSTEPPSCPFVEQFRTFCLSCPSVKDTVWGMGDTLQELLDTVHQYFGQFLLMKGSPHGS